jgi:hypothetical protein
MQEAEYERPCTKASETVPLDDEGLPPLPQVDRADRAGAEVGGEATREKGKSIAVSGVPR